MLNDVLTTPKVKKRWSFLNTVRLSVQFRFPVCDEVHVFAVFLQNYRKDLRSSDSVTFSIAVVTLQPYTRGKSFYLGKISLSKFTSGFIFPWLKGHTGDHWIKFQLPCSKFWRKNGKHARESNGSERSLYSYFTAVHYFI